MGAKGKTERRRHFNLWWWYWSNHPWLHPRLVLFTSTWRLAARVQQLTYMFRLYGEIVFPYVDVLKPCSLEVIWSQSALAISRKSCHPQLLLSWCRLASFSCVRARSNQSPTACLRLSSSTEKNAKLLLRSLWPCVTFLLSSNPDRFVRVYLSGLGGEATGGSGLCKPLRLCSRWGPLNNAEHCWTIVSIKCLVCGELPGVRNTTFPKKKAGACTVVQVMSRAVLDW